MKLSFSAKKWLPNEWFCTRLKSSKLSKIKFFLKKTPSSLFVQIRSSKRRADTLKCVSRYYLTFGVLRLRKIVLYNEIINKKRATKNQENPAHCFGENYLRNDLAKFLQYRIKLKWVGALTALVIYIYIYIHIYIYHLSDW